MNKLKEHRKKKKNYSWWRWEERKRIKRKKERKKETCKEREKEEQKDLNWTNREKKIKREKEKVTNHFLFCLSIYSSLEAGKMASGMKAEFSHWILSWGKNCGSSTFAKCLRKTKHLMWTQSSCWQNILAVTAVIWVLYSHLHVHSASQRHNTKDRCMKDNAWRKTHEETTGRLL